MICLLPRLSKSAAFTRFTKQNILWPNLVVRSLYKSSRENGMNVHLLGVGSSGCLMAFHLERALRSQSIYSNDKLILQLRRPPNEEQVMIRVYDKFESLEGECELPYETDEEHSDAPIDVMFVCTKADQTIKAIKPFLSRLTSNQTHGPSTIILFQNGMGVDDAMIKEFGWNDQGQHGNGKIAPFILSGINSNGTYLLKRFETVHAGQGSIPFALSPTAESRIGQEVSTQLINFAGQRKSEKVDSRLPFETLQWTLGLLSTPYLQDRLGFNLERFASDLNIRQLQKLVVNCAVNALTAIHDVRNGTLIKDPTLQRWADEIIKECAYIIDARYKRSAKSNPTWKSEADIVPIELRFDSLQQKVWQTIHLTAKNWNSMVQDIRSKRGATEIDFLNGIMVNWAFELGLQAPINEELVRLVREKTKI